MAIPPANIVTALEALLDNNESVFVGLLDLDGLELSGVNYVRIEFSDWLTVGVTRENASAIEFPAIGVFEIGGVGVFSSEVVATPFAHQQLAVPVTITAVDQPRFLTGALVVQVP